VSGILGSRGARHEKRAAVRWLVSASFDSVLDGLGQDPVANEMKESGWSQGGSS
jgi:hypothetical protein